MIFPKNATINPVVSRQNYPFPSFKKRRTLSKGKKNPFKKKEEPFQKEKNTFPPQKTSFKKQKVLDILYLIKYNLIK